MNWLITQILLWVIAGILCLVLIGLPLLFLLSLVIIVFPIIGTIKAVNGEIWPYPCSLRFFK